METVESGAYIELGAANQSWLVEWSKLGALSAAFADKMSTLADIGIASFRGIEMDFLCAYPQAIKEDNYLAAFAGLTAGELEAAISTRLHKIFHSRPADFSAAVRAFMADAYYYVVTIKESRSEKVLGFITFMSGGPVPANECKIAVLAVDAHVRRAGLASMLINALNKIGSSYKKICVSTRPSNVVALTAYKKWGFMEDGAAQENVPSHFIKGHWVHLVRYESQI